MKTIQRIFLCVALSASAFSGGIINNGDLVGYENFLLGFETRYPKSWSRLEMSSAVNFIAKPHAPLDPSFVVVLQKELPLVQSVSELSEYVRVEHPSLTFVETTLAGVAAFQSVLGNVGLIYLFKGNGNVLCIRFKSANERDAELIQLLLESLRLN